MDLQSGAHTSMGFSLRRSDVAPSTIVERASERFRTRHPDRGLSVDIAPALPTIHVDATPFRRVLDNLLAYANKYSPDRSDISIAVTTGKGLVMFEVADDGMSISDSDLPRVFDPYFRAELSRSRGTGVVGLGLTLATRILESARRSNRALERRRSRHAGLRQRGTEPLTLRHRRSLDRGGFNMISVINFTSKREMPMSLVRSLCLGLIVPSLWVGLCVGCSGDSADEASEGDGPSESEGEGQSPMRPGADGCYIEANIMCDCELDEAACTEDVGIWTDRCMSCAT